MRSHVPLRHLRPSLSVIPHSSLCLLLSVRTRAGPTSASARPDTQTDPADCWDTKWGKYNWDTTREKTERRRIGGPIAAFNIFSHLHRFFDLTAYQCFNKKDKQTSYSWKDVKIHKETKVGHQLRPSEHNQRARHTQLDR